MMQQGDIGRDIAALVRQAQEANDALLRGDMEAYLARVSHAEDCTLMAPFGGAPTRGFDTSEEHLAQMERFFDGGTSEIELVQAHASGDLVVLVLIEWQRAAVGGMPMQDWSLRVTQVYRREGAGWRLLHRHADPLVQGIGLEQAAALARG
jgi:ketosteroid isomerase-like protein